jgi:transglutaminase-like putative cysteine protease
LNAMPLLRSFRLSTYLTLGVACLCLGYAEGSLLPECPFITAAVLVILAVAYRLEGRWALSLRAANLVGAALALALVAWLAYQFVRPPTDLSGLPFPTSLLPYLGPVLLILIPAKLFRPKHVGDFWAMQGVGLLAVALGCALANDMLFGVLLVGYVVCFVWSLALFYLYREVRPGSAAESGRRLFLFRVTGRWSAGIIAAGLLLFLITPRPNDNKWELPLAARGKLETGLGDGNLDLNRTGALEQNKEVAFAVYAEDAAGNPKTDLDLDQRWRTAALTHYEQGRWARDRLSGLTLLEKAVSFPRPLPGPRDGLGERERRNALLPDFGPTAYYLTFTLHRGAGALNILADPVQWRAFDAPPVLAFGTRMAGGVQQRPDGTFEWLGALASGKPTYTQVTAPPPEPDLGPPLRVTSGYQDFLTRLPTGPTAERLRNFTAALLERLAREGRLPRAALTDLDPFTRQPLPKHHEAIAHALESYLARSGEYVYSLELKRKDRGIDPIEDFLYNTKSGHCQRFATALALMLRTQGVPAQLALGFRGCESRGDGNYEVRQDQAHVWVETVIARAPPVATLPPRPGEPARPRGDVSYHLLSLDPTPGGEPSAEQDDSLSGWLESTRAKGESFFRNFILGYDAAAREKAVAAAVERVEEFGNDLATGELTWATGAVWGVAVLVAAAFGGRRLLRRRRDETKDARRIAGKLVPFHGRLLALLAAAGYEPGPGETAREFAVRVAGELTRRGVPADAAATPERLADAYYRVRFGGRTLADDELGALDGALAQLETVLKDLPRPDAPAEAAPP